MPPPGIIAVVLSAWRPGSVVSVCIGAALDDTSVTEVHVWGYDPTGRAHVHPLGPTLYHRALAHFINKTTGDTLNKDARSKFSLHDDKKRVKWRAGLALDMWRVMSEARSLFPRATLLYLENDAVLKPRRIGTAHAALQRAGGDAAACYRAGSRTYEGAGNLCFLLTPRADPAPHLLGYHLVQPADWIVSDYSRGKWPAYDCASHGVPGAEHVSSRLLGSLPAEQVFKHVCYTADGGAAGVVVVEPHDHKPGGAWICRGLTHESGTTNEARCSTEADPRPLSCVRHMTDD